MKEFKMDRAEILAEQIMALKDTVRIQYDLSPGGEKTSPSYVSSEAYLGKS